MLTITFDETSRRPRYEQLYRFIRDEIASGGLPVGAKLPSKRSLAKHLSISLNTVENAYAQLAAEGFIETVEKKGYYVLPVVRRKQPTPAPTPAPEQPAARPGGTASAFVLRTNAVDAGSFPFATWSRLMRDSLREDHTSLVRELHPQGDRDLRRQIVDYLAEYRNMHPAPDQIVIGAGTTYLLGMLTELLPKRKFAIEEPGYTMLARTLQSRGAPFDPVPVDDEGMDPVLLRLSEADVCVVTPANQFPLCQVMSISRRLQLLDWASERRHRYIVEDDYDSDYRYALKPASTLYSLDRSQRVVYFNTFARTLTPSLRIAYMILPPALLDVYLPRKQLYSCTVSGFEQRTLLRFIRGGHYERHLNRMRTIYKRRRNAFLAGLQPLVDRGKIAIAGMEAGLHLLLSSMPGRGEKAMVKKAAEKGVTVFGLSDFFHAEAPQTHTVVAGFGGLDEQALHRAAAALCRAWR
ncbi:MAG: PLP-dependent aminotransferase family protein [Planctomycetaceae bacterium]|nr:PLP-dependent aminotransferase family protein [Planctomycetaceae bacterium]